MLNLLINRPYQQAMTSRLNGSEPEVVVPDGGRTQRLFTKAMFALMGRIAKMDGRVTRDNVEYADTIMALMGLRAAAKKQAIAYFNLGKDPNTDVLRMLGSLAWYIGARSTLASLFVKIQCRAAFSKVGVCLQEKLMLQEVAMIFGFTREEFQDICVEIYRMTGRPLTESDNRNQTINNAYFTLQLRPDVDDGEIRRAYLRMMSRYHPDKLMRDQLSDDALKLAQEKSTAIRHAYETICGLRKLRA